MSKLATGYRLPRERWTEKWIFFAACVAVFGDQRGKQKDHHDSGLKHAPLRGPVDPKDVDRLLTIPQSDDR